MTDAKLEKLKKLKESGALTQKEYNEEKKKLEGKAAVTKKSEPKAGKDTAYDRLIRHKLINSNWWMALAPLIGAVVGWMLTGVFEAEDEVMALGPSFVIVFASMVGFSILFCGRDKGILKEAGYESDFGIWFPPVYLRKRAKLLDEPNPAFWVWIALFVLNFLAIFAE